MKSDTFRAAAESKDFSALDEFFAEDVIFRSPVVFKPYRGREGVVMLLAAVAQVFEDFRYTDQVETGDTACSRSARARATASWTASTCCGSTAKAGVRAGCLRPPAQRRERPRRGDAANAREL